MFSSMIKKRMIVVPLIVSMGIFGVFTQTIRFQYVRAVDMVQLLASGACLGMALAALIFRIRSKSEQKT